MNRCRFLALLVLLVLSAVGLSRWWTRGDVTGVADVVGSCNTRYSVGNSQRDMSDKVYINY